MVCRSRWCEEVSNTRLIHKCTQKEITLFICYLAQAAGVRNEMKCPAFRNKFFYHPKINGSLMYIQYSQLRSSSVFKFKGGPLWFSPSWPLCPYFITSLYDITKPR